MKNRFKNQLFIILGLIVMITIVGCSYTSSTNSKPLNTTVSNEDSSKEEESKEDISKEETSKQEESEEETSKEDESDEEYVNTDPSKIDYLLCNATGRGSMAEVESGFYYLADNWLYYADRSNITNWVFVCNKPDCLHGLGNSACNAKIGHEIAQKEDKLYYYTNSSEKGYSFNQVFICQIAKDGSNPQVVFELKHDFNGELNGVRGIISQEAFVYAGYILGENGMYTNAIFRLEEDGSLHTLFSETSELLNDSITLPSYFDGARGDFTIMSSMLTEEDESYRNILFRVDGDKPERVNLPKNVSILGSYLTDETFTYYKSNEGFFEIDLESGIETCIFKNQLEDARGYVLTEDYIVECNRYNEYKPKEAYLKFYDGKNWLNVKMPEIVEKTDYPFFPVSVASDRVFFILSKGSAKQLYYFMLNERHPELMLATTIGDEDGKYFTIPEEESVEKGEISFFKKVDITIFDTEEYVGKVVGIGYDPEEPEDYQIRILFENKTDKKLTMYNDYMSINGLSVQFAKATIVEPKKTVEATYTASSFARPKIEYERQVTNVILSSYVRVEGEDKDRPITITYIYPYGEEEAIITEPLSAYEVVIDNEFVKVTTIEFSETEKKKISNPTTVRCMIENKTDKRIEVIASKLISVDGKSINNEMYLPIVVLPQSYTYYEIKALDSWIGEYEIGDNVEEYCVKLDVYTQTDNSFESNENLLYEEEIVLRPKL